MLCLSVKDIETDPLLCFETENYYKNLRRQAYTSVDFNSSDYAQILSDEKKLDHLGYSLSLALLSPRNLKDKEGRTWALSVYSDPSSKFLKIKIDEEPYRPDVRRNFCTSFPLDTLDWEKALVNIEFRLKVGKTAINLLLPENG